MRYVLLILSLTGDPKIEGIYEHAECEVIVRRINTQSEPGVWAHCLPLPT